MKVFGSIVLASAAAVSAFVPDARVNHAIGRSSQACLNAVPAKEQIGALPPLGFWDPLNFIENGPYGTPEENFFHYRSVEVKHGRVAMAATLGMITQELSRYQGYLSPSADLKFSDVPNGLAALKVVPLAGWVQMVALIGAHELIIKQREGRAPGDFGTGYFGVALDDQSALQLSALTKEVQNGRLAMLGILGMFASEIVHKGETLADFKFLG